MVEIEGYELQEELYYTKDHTWAKVEDDLSLISADPYGEGWLIKVKSSNPKDDLKALVHGDNVSPWIKKEIKSRKK